MKARHCGYVRWSQLAVLLAGAFWGVSCAPPPETPATQQPAAFDGVRVRMSVELEAPADEVWESVGDFGGIDRYVEAVAAVEVEGSGPGALRILTLQDGGKVVERLDARDEQARSLTYSIVESPLPIDSYQATLRVNDSEEGMCQVVWSSQFKVAGGASEEEMKSAIEGIYAMGFEGLRKLHGSP